MREEDRMIEALKNRGYGKDKPITSSTYVYVDLDGNDTAMEKHDRGGYPIDEGGPFGAYVDAYMWAPEWKLSAIGHAGGRGAQTRHNVRQANKALIGDGS